MSTVQFSPDSWNFGEALERKGKVGPCFHFLKKKLIPQLLQLLSPFKVCMYEPNSLPDGRGNVANGINVDGNTRPGGTEFLDDESEL